MSTFPTDFCAHHGYGCEHYHDDPDVGSGGCTLGLDSGDALSCPRVLDRMDAYDELAAGDTINDAAEWPVVSRADACRAIASVRGTAPASERVLMHRGNYADLLALADVPAVAHKAPAWTFRTFARWYVGEFGRWPEIWRFEYKGEDR